MTGIAGTRAPLQVLVPPSEPDCASDCRAVLATIQCYVDHECDPATTAAITLHLRGCRPCRAELAVLRWLKAAVRRCAGAPPAGDALTSS